MANNRINIHRFLAIIIAIGVVSYIAYLHYVNNAYERQIRQSENLVQTLLLRDSISKEILTIREDTTGSYYVFLRDINTDRTLTYSDLDSLYKYYKSQAEMYEDILLFAKRTYKFNYSYRVSGDSIKMSIWNKP